MHYTLRAILINYKLKIILMLFKNGEAATCSYS